MSAAASSIPSFNDARPLGLGDEAFVRELHDLLDRHDNLDRFGLCLLHEHFSVADDEILLESNNPRTRTLHLEVVKRAEAPESKLTSWRIGGPNARPLTDRLEDRGALEALTNYAEDKCKVEALTACAEDKCK